MIVLLSLLWLLVLAYVVLMLVYRTGWQRQPETVLPAGFNPCTRISVIIPARNEEQHIGACIRSILANDYPPGLFEILVIDDHSTDRTAEVASAFGPGVRCLSLASFLDQNSTHNSYKKKALETGIAQATAELIVTTDADCIVREQWLKRLAAVYETNKPAMIVGPVAFTTDGSVVQVFQSIDFMTMQGITGAAHRLGLGNMSNGANLAFSKKAFQEVGGYRGVDHLASGDDFLLMMKMKKAYPGGIAFLKHEKAIVRTAPQPDWSSFLQQRVRWASKSGKYDDKKLTVILLLVYLFNLSLFLLLIAGFWSAQFWLLALGFLLLKTAAELYFLLPVAAWFGKEKELRWFAFLQPLHILYIVAAGFLGFAGKYHWKGRKVK